MCSCHCIPECCVMFSGVKLSRDRLFYLLVNRVHHTGISSGDSSNPSIQVHLVYKLLITVCHSKGGNPYHYDLQGHFLHTTCA